MLLTKCVLGFGFTSENKAKISRDNSEAFCFNPKSVEVDGLGLVKFGRLIIPSDGYYRLAASCEVNIFSSNDVLQFGFDLMNQANTGSEGKFDSFAKTSIMGNNQANTYGIASDVVYLTANQMVGVSFRLGNPDAKGNTAYMPTLIVEKIA